jgi:uncharacterized protein (TIGR03435 family)
VNQLKFEKCGGGRFLAAGIPIIWIVEFAYHVQEDQVVDAPSWLRSFGDAYDIEAKSEGKVGEEQCRPMVQTLLEDRFRIATHWEPRRLAAFALVAGRRTDKLRAVTLDSPVGGVKINGGVQQSLSEPEAPSGWTMARFANYLANYAGRPVVDRTGLSGVYAFSFNFARSSQEEESDPSVFDAIQDQLGLKLKPIKADINVLVVDHIERPSVN